MQATTSNALPLTSLVAQAEHIFEEVRKNGPKIITDEGRPSCVLLSHEEYERIMDELAEAEIEHIAAKRLSKPRQENEYVTQKELDEEFGFTEKDLNGWEEVEIESHHLPS